MLLPSMGLCASVLFGISIAHIFFTGDKFDSVINPLSKAV
ncbi:hypothetical protein PROVRUST_05403 [Providencia rustigianii DSM 4541]|uniref:Uncharacterized protein n=2 Tax=Providencia TaxID=586 RepID=D1NZP9_9GAMM|nr:hypothetical protein PROVRUST_05403 [Providencia rustigianii DSM 4541]EUD09671.1 hypothetical protein HMPREF1563_2870 [Providencia alcalifaciens 205/92]